MNGLSRLRLSILFLLALPIMLAEIPHAHAAHPSSQRLLILTEDLAPYNYLKSNILQGGCTDVVRELIRRTGTELPQGIRVLPWSRAMAMAKTLPNVALFSTTRSPQREHMFHWVGPIYTTQVVMLKQCDNTIAPASLEQAKQYKIAVIQDYVEEDFLRQHNFPHIYSVPGTPEQIVYLLAHNRVDLWLQSWAAATFYANRAGKPTGWLEITFPVQKNELYIAFSKGTDPEILRRWQNAMQEMKQDGTYDNIIRRFEDGLKTGTAPVTDKAVSDKSMPLTN